MNFLYNSEKVRSSSGLAMVQLVSRRPLTVEEPFVTRASSCEIYNERSGNETGISPSTSVSPVSTIPPMLHTHFHLITTIIRKTTKTLLGGRFGVRTPVGATFSAPFQTYSSVNGYLGFPKDKTAGRGVDHLPHLAPRLKKE
jgi:hypothetical protein